MNKPEPKKPVGRPTKYNATMQALADRYVTDHLEMQGDLVPSAAGIACCLGIGKRVVYRWGDAHPRFRQTLDAIQVKQEALLINGGLGGTYNSNIVKLMLANHDYIEKRKTEITGGVAEAVLTALNAVDDEADEG